ncbi:MAG TPA: tRNA (adenosine(37)-N6)-threonylcarbamoyltransferase complex dimerization subunit type 1 TsaB [Kiritimatiellia bacterium]|jgi:tRNA threonylcarbamoyl adenosine modification protein YeaZ
MKILGLECSTRRAGVVVIEDGHVLAEASWDEPRAQHEALFQHIPLVLEQARVRIADIDVFAVGRGPGAFSGVRVALTAANAFALPFGKKVYAVSSGEALANIEMKRRSATRITIAGDARRGTLWFGVFGPAGQEQAWTVGPVTDFKDGLVVSPDAKRLADLGVRSEEAYPTALAVAELARARIAAGVPSDPLEPLYMHPPV